MALAITLEVTVLDHTEEGEILAVAAPSAASSVCVLDCKGLLPLIWVRE